MKIFQTKADINNFRWLHNEELGNIERGKENILGNWMKVPLIWREKKFPLGDFASISGLGTCLNGKVKEVIEAENIQDLQMPPIIVEDKNPYFLLSVSTILDAIDYDKAIPRRVDSGRIYMFDKYAFKSEILENVHLFITPELMNKRIYCTDKFKKLIEENNLTGLKFEEIWDSNKE